MRSEGNIYHPKPASPPKLATLKDNEEMLSNAIAKVCDIRYHQSFTLPADPVRGRDIPIRVTYADAGRSAEPADGLDKPVLLFTSGMFGGRHCAHTWGSLAADHGIRLVVVDRPGIGGTSPVALASRITVWLDMISALLDHLDVKYVSLAAHSAGTIYNLSFIINLRHLLHPQRPYAAFLAPWVPPRYSGVRTMQAAGILPGFMIKRFDRVVHFMHHHGEPAIRDIKTRLPKLSAMGAKGARKAKRKVKPPVATKPEDGTDPNSRRLLRAVEGLCSLYIFAEDYSGASQEALLCLEKGDTNWIGLPTALQQIAATESARIHDSIGGIGNAKLKLQAFYAESDEMIGKGGTTFLNSCLCETVTGGAVEVERFELKGTDHNDILWPGYEAVKVLMGTVAGKGDVMVKVNVEWCYPI